jgi:hypothetical protein
MFEVRERKRNGQEVLRRVRRPDVEHMPEVRRAKRALICLLHNSAVVQCEGDGIFALLGAKASLTLVAVGVVLAVLMNLRA